MSKDSGIVEIHGKQYQTVAYRVKGFREDFPMFTLATEILHRDEEVVVMKATILNEAGRVIATGHSEELRKASTINRTSALENAETSAIGRALAAFGLGGTEFATADEVANAISQQKQSTKSVAQDTWDSMDPEEQKFLQGVADKVRATLEGEGGAKEAATYYENEKLDNEERIAVWSRLTSKERSAIKAAVALRKAA